MDKETLFLQHKNIVQRINESKRTIESLKTILKGIENDLFRQKYGFGIGDLVQRDNEGDLILISSLSVTIFSDSKMIFGTEAKGRRIKKDGEPSLNEVYFNPNTVKFVKRYEDTSR